MQRFILMDNPSRLYTVIQEDLPAANGIIHIIDWPITNTLSDRPPRDERVRKNTSALRFSKKQKSHKMLQHKLSLSMFLFEHFWCSVFLLNEKNLPWYLILMSSYMYSRWFPCIKTVQSNFISLTQPILQQSMEVKVIFWSSSSFVQFADKTIGEILTKDEKYNRFLSLVDVSILF